MRRRFNLCHVRERFAVGEVYCDVSRLGESRPEFLACLVVESIRGVDWTPTCDPERQSPRC